MTFIRVAVETCETLWASSYFSHLRTHQPLKPYNKRWESIPIFWNVMEWKFVLWISLLNWSLLSAGLWRESFSVWLEVLDSWETWSRSSSSSHHRFYTWHTFSIISLPLQLWKHTFNRLLVALAVFDLMFVFSTVPIHVFPLFEYNNRLFALLYSRWYTLYFFQIEMFSWEQNWCSAELSELCFKIKLTKA